MRIGLMLRGIDKRGGTGVYARNLVPELLRQGSETEWVLLYSSPHQLGSVALPAENAREAVLEAPHPLWWDQVSVPRYARANGIDLLFNAKFTLPLVSAVPGVMALHGASWYVIPECYPWWDVQYIQLSMPRYCSKAAHLVSNSECTTRDYIEIVGVPPEKISTVPLAAAPIFRPVTDPTELDRVRSKYSLPADFVLSVVAYDPRKNVPRLLQAFRNCRREIDCQLVLIGRGCDRFRSECTEVVAEIGPDLVTPGWVDQADLPAIYSLATVFFFPSLYEEFGIPNCEAMACGTPIVTANTGAPPEVVDDAAVLVDPRDTRGMGEELATLLSDRQRRAELSRKGLERSRLFSWKRTSRETLEVLDRVHERLSSARAA